MHFKWIVLLTLLFTCLVSCKIKDGEEEEESAENFVEKVFEKIFREFKNSKCQDGQVDLKVFEDLGFQVSKGSVPKVRKN